MSAITGKCECINDISMSDGRRYLFALLKVDQQDVVLLFGINFITGYRECISIRCKRRGVEHPFRPLTYLRFKLAKHPSRFKLPYLDCFVLRHCYDSGSVCGEMDIVDACIMSFRIDNNPGNL